jgi:hypothetical protein
MKAIHLTAYGNPSENLNPQQHRPKTHKTPERNQRAKSEQQFNTHRPPQRERSVPKDLEHREGDIQVSQGRLITSPTHSPTRNKRSPPHTPQNTYVESHQSSSPHKPRKVHDKYSERTATSTLESNSPPKGPSPQTTRWAGPAFSNAPPPSSLPLPDFPPFLPSSSPPSASSSSSSSPSSSPPSQSVPATIPILYYPDPRYYIQTPHIYTPPQFSVQFAYSDIPQPPSLAQLSMDLRKMLNINEQPIPA